MRTKVGKDYDNNQSSCIQYRKNGEIMANAASVLSLLMRFACLLESESSTRWGCRTRRAAVIVTCRHDLLQKMISIYQTHVCDFREIATCFLRQISRENHHRRQRQHGSHSQNTSGKNLQDDNMKHEQKLFDGYPIGYNCIVISLCACIQLQRTLR